MKKFHFLLIVASIFHLTVRAQGIYQFWGTTMAGGEDNTGVMFTTKADASGYIVQKDFTVSHAGQATVFNKPLVYNNKMYAMLSYGGLNDDGIIGEYDPATDTWVKKADLFSIGGSHTSASLVLHNNKMYGVTSNGGFASQGVLFEFNPANGALTKLHDFNNSTGSDPFGSLVVFNSKLYGVAETGGLNGDGALYEFDLATNAYTKKADFNLNTTGSEPHASLLVYAGKFWGSTQKGAAMDRGALFSYDPATNILSKKVDYNSIGVGGQRGVLTMLNNKLYGAANHGGANGIGAIFQYDPIGNTLSKEFDFSLTTGRYDMEFTVLNNKLYSCNSYGSMYNDGEIFSYDPAANTYASLIPFSASIGSMGAGSLTLYNGKFYGFTIYEGSHMKGTLFTYNPAENSFVSLKHFGGVQFQQPSGPLMYLNNKIYGTASAGGATQNGGIFEYDIATGSYAVKLGFNDSTGRVGNSQGGFLLYNNKFYGVAIAGGAYGYGAIYQYDPTTNVLIRKHDFNYDNGSHPRGTLSEFNGKLYGTCSDGGGGGFGNIFEFDPATNAFAERVAFDQVKGRNPYNKLTLYNNKFYGLNRYGGNTNGGTLFEYNPSTNVFTKKVDFNGTNGEMPMGGLSIYNNMLYGYTYFGGTTGQGTIFQFDPANSTLTKRFDLNSFTGYNPHSNLSLLNNKLHGITNSGGNNNVGTTIQFDPLTGTVTRKADLSVKKGILSDANELTAIPAMVAPGSDNACINSQTININAANANEWIPFTDGEGRAVAEIKANGNVLGNTTVRFYINGGNIRIDGNGTFYLDRNITITSANTPASPVDIRLYVRKKEVDDLKATAGSGVNSPADISIYKNTDFCLGAISAPTEKLVPTFETWGSDYVFTLSVSSFSSFYFAGKNNVVLPVHILSFKGTPLPAKNRLEWKVSCTENVTFTVQRSTDGINFTAIGQVEAIQQDCNHPFVFDDENIAGPRYYYRLLMKELNAAGTYSPVIVLSRTQEQGLQVNVYPNPVVGAIAKLNIVSDKKVKLNLVVVDMNGRIVTSIPLNIPAGNTFEPINLSGLASGVYQLRYDDGERKGIIKIVKQ
ncbi:MAG: T9SS type A sorting domain-containing protein [Rhizobacter sp.]|nr:T9SS type A sorting domain-containing protein [Ferruginibacter sp.]